MMWGEPRANLQMRRLWPTTPGQWGTRAGGGLLFEFWYREKSCVVSKGLTLTFHLERDCCPPQALLKVSQSQP